MKTLVVLSFVSLNGQIKYCQDEQQITTDLNKAMKFKNSKAAEKFNATLDTKFYTHTIREIAPDFWM